MVHKKCLAKVTKCDCINDDIEELQRLRKRQYEIKKIEEFRDRLCQINGECEELINDIDLWIERRMKK